MNNPLYDEPEYLEYKRLEREAEMDEFCDWINRTEEERVLYEEFG